MQTFSKLRNETAPWRAIGDLLYGMRIGGEVESSALDHIVAGNLAFNIERLQTLEHVQPTAHIGIPGSLARIDGCSVRK